MASMVAASLYGSLGATFPVGSRDKATGRGSEDEVPLKLAIFVIGSTFVTIFAEMK